VGPKPTNVKTFTKKYYGGMIDIWANSKEQIRRDLF
jgi:hypothetical protein